jgi:hypothetical protein
MKGNVLEEFWHDNASVFSRKNHCTQTARPLDVKIPDTAAFELPRHLRF